MQGSVASGSSRPHAAQVRPPIDGWSSGQPGYLSAGHGNRELFARLGPAQDFTDVVSQFLLRDCRHPDQKVAELLPAEAPFSFVAAGVTEYGFLLSPANDSKRQPRPREVRRLTHPVVRGSGSERGGAPSARRGLVPQPAPPPQPQRDRASPLKLGGFAADELRWRRTSWCGARAHRSDPTLGRLARGV